MLAALRREFPQAELTGIDESEHAVELTAGREHGRASRCAPAFTSFRFRRTLSTSFCRSMSGATPGWTMRSPPMKPIASCAAGGKLILNLAAFEFLKGAHDCATDVDRRYTRRQVRALLEGANFEIERLTYWNAALTPPIALVRWLSRMRLAPRRAALRFPPAPVVR